MNSEKIRAFLKEKIDRGLFTGSSVIFGKVGEKILEIHEGHLGKNLVAPVTGNTLFDLQSITKAVVTAPLCYSLINKAYIKADTNIGPLLKKLGIVNPEMYEVTFADLLTHCSGLSDVDLEGTFEKPSDLWTHMLNAKPRFKPGTSIEYTDLGFRILGRLIETQLNTDLNTAASEQIWKKISISDMTFQPKNLNQIAATPDAHGIIDDEQVHFLGDILGCDGVFGSANALFKYMSSVLENPDLINFLNNTTRSFENSYSSFFDALAIGPKSAGWEKNPGNFSYAGKFHSNSTFEKAGGAGTFIWFDKKSKYIFVYLTNYGKPKPFDGQSWNQLINSIEPYEVSNLIYETL